MTDTAAMLNAHPAGLPGADTDALVLCIQECATLAQAATSCADACLSATADAAHLSRCAGICLTAADLATTTMRLLSRPHAFDSTVARATLVACIAACHACYDQCRTHSLEHEHCLICAAAAQRCAQACQSLLDDFA